MALAAQKPVPCQDMLGELRCGQSWGPLEPKWLRRLTSDCDHDTGTRVQGYYPPAACRKKPGYTREPGIPKGPGEPGTRAQGYYPPTKQNIDLTKQAIELVVVGTPRNISIN